jgi:glycosyltransferase involved in cell wall biosynthesis
MVAMACAPGSTSETGVAWQAILALHEDCESLTVVTHGSHRTAIETWRSTNPEELSNCEFRYIGEPLHHHKNQHLARLLIWKHYAVWMQEVLAFIQKELNNARWDVCHHVTYSTWRLGSPFYKCGLPTVWGPIGGAGRVPWNCLRTMSLAGKVTEVLRDILSAGYARSSSLQASLSKNTVVLASNTETASFLAGIDQQPVSTIFPLWFSSSEPFTKRILGSGPLKCFTGGGIIASKGISFSLLALAELRKAGIEVDFDIAGYGPEKSFLTKMINDLDLGDNVRFLPFLTGDAYSEKLRECDIFLFPSFRENIGMTMVEAMLHEQAPIVLNRSAPGEIVTPECGWIVDALTPASITHGIFTAVQEAVSNTNLLRKKQTNARKRILTNYSKNSYSSRILTAYATAINNHAIPNACTIINS